MKLTRPQPVEQTPAQRIDPLLTVQELAKRWRVSEDTVRRKARKNPGALNFGSPDYHVYRLPLSWVERVERLSRAA